MDLQAVIRNVNKKEDGTGFRIGIAFESISQTDRFALHYFTNTLAQKTHG
jgi:hypothetical protein